MANGKKKGSKNERAIAKLWEKWTGYEFTRVPASGGLRWQRKNDTVGDLICSDDKHSRFFNFSIECKSYADIDFSHLLVPTKNTQILTFWDQCVEDAERAGKIPILFMRYNNLPKDFYFVAVSLKYWVNVLQVHMPVLATKGYIEYKSKSPNHRIAILSSEDLFKVNYAQLHKSTKQHRKTIKNHE